MIAGDDRADAAIEVLQTLVAAQRQGEAAVQAVIAARLREAGCDVRDHDYTPSDVPVIGEFAQDFARNPEPRRAVVGSIGHDPSLPSLLIFAHPDGEPVANTESWRHDPFAGEIENGRLYGWGVADDLAGCAAALLAIEAVAAEGRPMGRAIFASTPSKRYARGVAALLHDGLRADASLYLHPAESGVGMREIKALASGQLEFRIKVTGRGPDTTEPGHTAFSHQAHNPVDKAFAIKSALDALATDRAARIRHPKIEAVVGRATNLHVSRMSCGEMKKFSRIHPVAELGGALSFPPGETLDDIKREIEGAVAAAAVADPWLADHPPEITWVAGTTGAEVDEDHPLYRTASAAVGAVTGAAPFVNAMHTSSDIRNPAVEAGIPCVGLGCLGGDLSQNDRHDEWIDVADFLAMVEVTRRITRDWCSGRAGRPTA